TAGHCFLRHQYSVRSASGPYRLIRVALLLSLPEQQTENINDKENHDSDLQPQHAAVVEFAGNDAVDLAQFTEPVLHALPPLVEVEAVARADIDPGHVPVAKELGDVRDLIIQLGDIDSQSPKRLERGQRCTPSRPPLQVLIHPVQVLVQALIEGAEFLQLHVG